MNLIVAACVASCKAGGYTVAGVEYGKNTNTFLIWAEIDIDQPRNVIVPTTLLEMPHFSTMTLVV